MRRLRDREEVVRYDKWYRMVVAMITNRKPQCSRGCNRRLKIGLVHPQRQGNSESVRPGNPSGQLESLDRHFTRVKELVSDATRAKVSRTTDAVLTSSGSVRTP